jgi:hypothetical protein
VKPLVVGHWGTTPGQNFIYVHLNRVIKKYDLDMFYIAGPGHGGPALVGHTYLEVTYSEIYPDISQDEAGLRKLFTQFSFPGGSPVTWRRRLRDRSTKAVSWVEAARAADACVVLPEGTESRIVQAAVACAERGIARSVLLGPPDQVAGLARSLGLRLPAGVTVVDPQAAAERYTLALTAIQSRA